MKISIISDVHIIKNNDSRDLLLTQFFNNKYVLASDYIILLGDIFEVMAGYHKKYLELYPNFYSNLIEASLRGQKVLYFEGNHDVHLNTLIKYFNKKNKLTNKIEVVSDYRVFSNNDKLIYFSHGDDIELDNGMYESWKKFLKSPIAEIIFTILPFVIIEWVGNFLSRKSKGHSKIMFNEDKNREKFRRSAKAFSLKGYDYIVSGHSHVKDNFIFKARKRTVQYINNGYALSTKSFIYYDGVEFKFIDLKVS